MEFAISHVRPKHIRLMDMIDGMVKLPFAQMITQFLQAYCVPLIPRSFNYEALIIQDTSGTRFFICLPLSHTCISVLFLQPAVAIIEAANQGLLGMMGKQGVTREENKVNSVARHLLCMQNVPVSIISVSS